MNPYQDTTQTPPHGISGFADSTKKTRNSTQLKTPPHGISGFADSTKKNKLEIQHNSKLHHMASLDLLILQKLEIQQNWNFTTWHLWIC